MPSPGSTPLRNIRVPDDKWAEIDATARKRGTDRTEVLLAAYDRAKTLKTFARPAK